MYYLAQGFTTKLLKVELTVLQLASFFLKVFIQKRG